MRRALLLSAVVAALAAPAASASATRDHRGGCGFRSDNSGSTGSYSAFIDTAVVVFSAVDPLANPVSATVECRLLVNGYPVFTTSASGTVVVADTTDVHYDVTETDQLALCTRITYDNGETDGSCDLLVTFEVPPPGLVDHLPHVDPIQPELWYAADPVVCPVLVSLAPGVPGVVDINAEGDVRVAGEPVWDCPPYTVT